MFSLPMPNLHADWQLWVYGLTFIVGLCFGSFLNLVADRFLAEESIITPSSYCEHTKKPLRWFENIPLVSYLLQWGQSRHTGQPISILYPLAELFTAVLFVGVVWYAGLTWQTLFLLFLAGNLVVITLTDLKESLIFHVNSMILIPVGLIYNAFDFGQVSETVYRLGPIPIYDSLVSAIIGILLAWLFFEGMILFSKKVFGTDGFGHGDTHLMMGVGAFLGWKLMLMGLFLGFIFQGIPAIPVMVYQWFQRKDYVSIAAGVSMAIFGFLPVWLAELPINNVLLRSGLVLGSFLLAMVSMFIFLKRARDNQSFTYLPLGPALVFGSIVALFWGQQLINSYLG